MMYRLISRWRVAKSEQELQQASVHVKYELDMLAAMISFLSKGLGGTDCFTWNAYLESFVLHVRNLIDFFYLPKKSRFDDILAEDFVTNVPQWKEDRLGLKSPLMDEAKTRVDKLAAHLTYKRLTLDPKWKFADIRADLQHVFNCFFNHLPPGRTAWFQGAGSQGPVGTAGAQISAGGAGSTETVTVISPAGGMVSS